MTPRNHKDLRVWQSAHALGIATHKAVDRFSREHRITYGDQFRRAAVSVGSNIAEGAARKHRREFVQFLYIARGSLSELHGLIQFAIAVELCNAEALESLERQAETTARMLTRMIKALGSG